MAQTKIHIDPNSTRSILESLGYAIDEIKLVRSIDRLSEQSQMYAHLPPNPGHQRHLAIEIRDLSNRLVELREKAQLLKHDL